MLQDLLRSPRTTHSETHSKMQSETHSQTYSETHSETHTGVSCGKFDLTQVEVKKETMEDVVVEW